MDINAFEGTAFDSASFQVATLVDLAASEAPDIASGGVAVYWSVDLAATEAPDTLAANVLVTDGLILAAVEAPDTASGSVSVYWEADLAATEAPDVAAGDILRNVPFAADAGVFTLQGNSAVLAFDRALLPVTGQYSKNGNTVTLAHFRRINAQSIDYNITGVTPRLFLSSFFYNDTEIVFVPPEIQSVLIVPEAREIAVTADWSVERLEEDRDPSGEPRLRAV